MRYEYSGGIELAKLILNTDLKIIEFIKQVFIEEKSAGFWDDLTSDQQEEIMRASSEFDQGKSIDFDSFLLKHR